MKQQIIAVLIVISAIIYLVLQLLTWFRSGRGSKCSKCECAQTNSPRIIFHNSARSLPILRQRR